MIRDLRLQNFRSYIDDSFEFEPGVNIIVGPNASGKTNLLEALLVLGRGSSYRSKDADLVMFDKPWARLDANVNDHKRTVKLQYQADLLHKTIEIDSHTFKRISSKHFIPQVLFEPNHLLLLHGSPERRREYIDGVLGLINAGYTSSLRHYKRALAQRNALLKSGSFNADQLFVWNLRLSELGGLVAVKRNELLITINKHIETIYRDISGTNDVVEVLYDSVCSAENYSTHMLKLLETNQRRDTERGFTSVGPHRDDILFFLRSHEAGEAASRGEVRTLLLAMKIIELSLVEEVYNQSPVLLLDDVFSELDGARRKALTEVMKGYQTFITTTDADVVVQHFMQSCHIIPLG